MADKQRSTLDVLLAHVTSCVESAGHQLMVASTEGPRGVDRPDGRTKAYEEILRLEGRIEGYEEILRLLHTVKAFVES